VHFDIKLAIEYEAQFKLHMVAIVYCAREQLPLAPPREDLPRNMAQEPSATY
jgi:hypothetical protein